jgi:hypothetical protein
VWQQWWLYVCSHTGSSPPQTGYIGSLFNNLAVVGQSAAIAGLVVLKTKKQQNGSSG